MNKPLPKYSRTLTYVFPTPIPFISTLIAHIPALIAHILTLIVRIPILITCIPIIPHIHHIPTSRIPNLIPDIPNLIPRILTPCIPFLDSPFQLLQFFHAF